MFWGGQERRKSVRVQIRMTVHVRFAGQPRFYEAVSRDISVTGASLVLRHHLDPPLPVYLEFRLPDSVATLYCPAHVIWSSETPIPSLDGKAAPVYTTGVEFDDLPRAVRSTLKRFIAEQLKRASPST